MAPVGESVYFPTLDKCLNRHISLLSWKTAFTALAQLDPNAGASCLERHLTDSAAIELLSQPFSPFSKPTPESKANFETRTSAINVTPTVHGNHNIKELKDDSLWLTNETHIDEVSALRIAVLEWQERPSARLLQESDEETKGLDSSNASGRLGASLFSSTSSLSVRNKLADKANGVLDSPEARHLRLLDIYLSERLYLLKTAEYVLCNAWCKASSPRNKSKSREAFTWVEELGDTFRVRWLKSGNSFVSNAVGALQSRIEGLEKGSEWRSGEDVQEYVEIAWARNQMLEMIHIMQMVLIIVESTTDMPTSGALLSWFRFVGRCNFFDHFVLPHQGLSAMYNLPLQSIATLVSLAVLKVTTSLTSLPDLSDLPGSEADNGDKALYLMSPSCVNEINDILVNSAAACLLTASPAVFAWSIILQTLRELALSSKASRELRHAQLATEKYSTTESFENDAGENAASRGATSHRRLSIGSDSSQQQTSLLEDVFERVQDPTGDEDLIEFMARSAVNQTQVFDLIISLAVDFCTPYGSEHNGQFGKKMRLILLDLIRAAVPRIEYGHEVISATLAVLNGSECYWDVLGQSQWVQNDEPSSVFLGDPFLTNRIFNVALSRFPYETFPFLKICRSLASLKLTPTEDDSSIDHILGNLRSMTSLIPNDFGGYELKQFRTTEETEDSFVQLTTKLGLLTMGSSPFGPFELPERTEGQVLTSEKPLIVKWSYSYSGLAFMGKSLQQVLVGSELQSSQDAFGSKDLACEIIGLITNLITSASKVKAIDGDGQTDPRAARIILEEASDALDRNQDIVSIIFQIFENELYKRQLMLGSEDASDLLVGCIHFTHALIGVLPGRVWPFLARSGLLGVDGKESKLNAVVTNIEMIKGKYPFLLGCIRVFDALVEDALAHALSRKSRNNALTRFGDRENLGAGISELQMEKITTNFEKVMVDVLESTNSWKFVHQEDRLEINTRICIVFQKILSYNYRVDGTVGTSPKLFSVLVPAARHLLDVFLTSHGSELPMQVLQMIFQGVLTPHSTLPLRGSKYWALQVKAAADLTIMLLQSSKYLGYSSTRLIQKLLEATPILAKVYTVHDIYRLPIVELFEALVNIMDISESQPPSLFGHLGQGTAKCFLEILSTLDKPLDDENLSIAIWRLLSAVISRRQRWFAIFLLAGNTPRDSLKRNKCSKDISPGHVKPMLNVAIDALTNIEKLQPKVALGMLEFVALAADYWPWVVMEIRKYSDYLRAMADFVERLDSRKSGSGVLTKLTDYNKVMMTSFIAEIFAMDLHYGRQTGEASSTAYLLPRLSYLIRQGLAAPSYNASLHGNLRRNFNSKFSPCTLDSFKKTSFSQAKLGTAFYYDIELADKLCSYDPAWAEREGKGFAAEFVRANENFSLVEAEVNLLQSWKFLFTELSRDVDPNKGFKKEMASVTRDCLQSNAQNTSPEAIFTRLAQSRMDLAFTVLQRLIEICPTDAEVKTALSSAWKTLRPYATALGSSLTGDDAVYCRTLLKILYLAIQAHTSEPSLLNGAVSSDPSKSNGSAATLSEQSPTIQTVLDVLGTLVAPGFRSLTKYLHDDISKVLPTDFMLLIAILRTAIHVPGVDKHASQLITHFTDDNTARYAATLLSWSDKIAVDHDPIYGEISIMFLLELSRVPALAESIAVEGILTHIARTDVMNYYHRPKGMGPFDDPPRMYSIWTRGILPLTLSLLSAIGPPIAAEVSAFLNQFPNQLARASAAFENKPISTSGDLSAGAITLSLAYEAQSLALVAKILDTFREAGASAGVVAGDIAQLAWDRQQVKEDIDSWMQRRSALFDRIVATNEREEKWMRQKAVAGEGKVDREAQNLLEEKVLRELAVAVGILADGEE